MRVQLTVRVEPHTADYIATQAGQARQRTGIRLTANQVAAAFLERAEAEGWSINPGSRATAAPPPQTSAPGNPLTMPTPGADPNQEG
jgi:hypothetical protein